MARMPPSTFSRCILYWRTRHLLLRFLCLHEAAILALLVVILLTRFQSIFLGLPLNLHFGDCSSRTLFSSLWSAMEYRRCQPPCTRFIASDDSHSKSVKYMDFSHARDAVYGVSKCTFCKKPPSQNPPLEVFERESSVFLRRAPEASAAFRESVSLQIGLCVYAWRPTAETSTSHWSYFLGLISSSWGSNGSPVWALRVSSRTDSDSQGYSFVGTLKRVGDLQALSVSEMCMDFAPGLVKVTLRPRPGYVPKVWSASFRSKVVTLHSFHPPPFASGEDERLHMLCPVRAFKIYVDRSKLSEEISLGAGRRGLATSKHIISHWVRDAISLAYEVRGLPSPLSVRAHSTRSVAFSQALFRGVLLEDICVVAGWSSPHIFIRFYNLDIDTALGSQVLSVWTGRVCCLVRKRAR